MLAGLPTHKDKNPLCNSKIKGSKTYVFVIKPALLESVDYPLSHLNEFLLCLLFW